MQLSLISLALTKVYGGAAAFSPSSLFASGEQGAWYDPSDLSTMFQDSAGTIPVTGDGQPVGKILDKSGRGNHASQATANSRPLYKTDGTYHWLQFDGVDDSLSTAAINFASTDKMSVFCGFRKINTGVSAFLVELSDNALSNDCAFYIKAFDSGLDYTQCLLRDTDYLYSNFPNAASPVTLVATAGFDISGNSDTNRVTLRLNGVGVSRIAGNSRPSGTGNFGNYPINIFSRSGPNNVLSGNMYSMIIRGATSTVQEVANTEAYLSGKTGVFF